MFFIPIILHFCEVFINIIFTFYCIFGQMFWAHHFFKKGLYQLVVLFLQGDTPFLSQVWPYGSKDRSPGKLWGEGQEAGTQEGKGRRGPSLPGTNLTGHSGGGETGGMVLRKLPPCGGRKLRSHFGLPNELPSDLISYSLCFSSHISLPFRQARLLFCFWCSHSTVSDSAAFQLFCISACVWMSKCIHS